MRPATDVGPDPYASGPIRRGLHIDEVDHVGRPLIAIGTVFPDGHVIEPHRHRRGQLISGASGVIVLSTAAGTWVMPPQRGMWIPPATEHHVRTVGEVRMQSLCIWSRAPCPACRPIARSSASPPSCAA